jgi:hypothetical protein
MDKVDNGSLYRDVHAVNHPASECYSRPPAIILSSIAFTAAKTATSALWKSCGLQQLPTKPTRVFAGALAFGALYGRHQCLADRRHRPGPGARSGG